jgi:hypothetical protein
MFADKITFGRATQKEHVINGSNAVAIMRITDLKA